MSIPDWLLPLTKISGVKDILLFGDQCLVDCGFGLQPVKSPLASSESLERSLRQLAFDAGARLDIASPMLDLSIGSTRLHMMLPHGVCSQPSLSVRVHSAKFSSVESLIENNMLSEEQATFLQSAVANKKTIVLCGPTSSGKTTLLRALLANLKERIITIEQVPELFLDFPAIALTARENNQEGVGEITLSQLVVQSLRMRPDRVVVGEVRKDELVAFLQAVSNGHPGSLTTLHATSLEQIPQRLSILGLLAGFSKELTHHLASSIDLFVQLERSPKQKVAAIATASLRNDELKLVRI
ncbi:MAG: CpaF family protein [Aquiluna sp.]|jgi:pilus assembly protein CpaF